MDLVERYLNAIHFWLPKDQKADVIAELAEDIRSQIEERESELGRTLNEEDLSSLLKQRGSPFSVAGKFLTPRTLIGPALFPVYVFVLKLATGFYLIPWLAVWLGLVAFSPSYRAAHSGFALLETLGGLWNSAFITYGLITLGFAVGEHARGKSAARKDWDPGRLPAVRDGVKIPRFSSVAGIVVNIIFLTWWMGGYRFPAALASDGTGLILWPVALWADFRSRFLLPIAVIVLGATALAAFNLIRPYWTRLRLGARAALNAAAAAVSIAFLGDHSAEIWAAWEKVKDGAAGLSGAEKLHAWAGLSTAITLACVAFGCLLAVVLGLIRIARWETVRVRGVSAPKE
jgi:hypothetical protein